MWKTIPIPPETDPEQAQQLQDPLMNSWQRPGDCTGLYHQCPRTARNSTATRSCTDFSRLSRGEKR